MEERDTPQPQHGSFLEHVLLFRLTVGKKKKKEKKKL
jgi:hypothetical protein